MNVKVIEFNKLHSDDAGNQTAMMEYIKADLRRYYIITGKSLNPPTVKKIRIIFENYGFHAIIVYRIGRWIELVHRNTSYVEIRLFLNPFDPKKFLVVY